MKTVLSIVGARPQFVKAAVVSRALAEHGSIREVLLHTGQHFDANMSDVFFRELSLRRPDRNLGIGGGRHGAMTGEQLARIEEVLLAAPPDLVLVYGDTNSTLAGALAAAKLHIPVAHVEAGLRSFNRRMPEEINRVLTDAISDLLFTTEVSANQNLAREGVDPAKVHFVGNLMIDSLVGALDAARRSPLRTKLGLRKQGYAVLTLHRPSNVDDASQLMGTLSALSEVANNLPVIFPVHPRTHQKILASGFDKINSWDGESVVGDRGIWTMPPASYLDFLGLVDGAAMVITDSGGIQEETTYLGVPCLTYRDNTERPVSVTMGTNRLIGADPSNIVRHVSEVLRSMAPRNGIAAHRLPPLWDGNAAARIVSVLRRYLGSRQGNHLEVAHMNNSAAICP